MRDSRRGSRPTRREDQLGRGTSKIEWRLALGIEREHVRPAVAGPHDDHLHRPRSWLPRVHADVDRCVGHRSAERRADEALQHSGRDAAGRPVAPLRGPIANGPVGEPLVGSSFASAPRIVRSSTWSCAPTLGRGSTKNGKPEYSLRAGASATAAAAGETPSVTAASVPAVSGRWFDAGQVHTTELRPPASSMGGDRITSGPSVTPQPTPLSRTTITCSRSTRSPCPTASSVASTNASRSNSVHAGSGSPGILGELGAASTNGRTAPEATNASAMPRRSEPRGPARKCVATGSSAEERNTTSGTGPAVSAPAVT